MADILVVLLIFLAANNRALDLMARVGPRLRGRGLAVVHRPLVGCGQLPQATRYASCRWVDEADGALQRTRLDWFVSPEMPEVSGYFFTF